MTPTMTLASSLVLIVSLSSQSAKQNDYLRLAATTVARPITHAELETAVVAPEGIAAIRALFERSINERLHINGALVTPELGGESMLRPDGRLDLVVYPDPNHPLIRELVSRKGEPESLLGFLESSEPGRLLLKNTGGLHALLYQMVHFPSDGQRVVLDGVLEHAVAQHFKTWTTDPGIQAELIEQTKWTGRYLGFWHLHPVRLKDSIPTEGIEPSMSDMRNAIDLGQFITIVFQPDGFDLYDLSPLKALGHEDLSATKRIRYRSEEWRSHFQSKLAVIQNAAPP